MIKHPASHINSSPSLSHIKTIAPPTKAAAPANTPAFPVALGTPFVEEDVGVRLTSAKSVWVTVTAMDVTSGLEGNGVTSACVEKASGPMVMAGPRLELPEGSTVEMCTLLTP